MSTSSSTVAILSSSWDWHDFDCCRFDFAGQRWCGLYQELLAMPVVRLLVKQIKECVKFFSIWSSSCLSSNFRFCAETRSFFRILN